MNPQEKVAELQADVARARGEHFRLVWLAGGSPSERSALLRALAETENGMRVELGKKLSCSLLEFPVPIRTASVEECVAGYALGVITDLGFVQHAEAAGCYVLGHPLRPSTSPLSGWLVRAWFAATGSPTVIDRVVMAGSPGFAYFDSASLIADSIEAGVLVPERLSFSQDVLRLSTPITPADSRRFG